MQPKWWQKIEVGGGAAHSKQESRPWSRGLAGGSGSVSARSGGWSRPRGEDEDFCRSEREEETMAVSGVGVAGLWVG
jgi:hypothetical protein